MEKMRKSNFELLRIFAMLLIVAHHFAVHTNFQFPSSFTTINRAWIQFIAIGGKIGVNIFVLISGYFLVHADNVKWNKVFKLWSSLLFYSLGIYIFFVMIGRVAFSWENFLNSFFPVGTRRWWFASTYLVLYIFTPYINRVLLSLNKQQFQKLLILATILWCVLPTIKNYSYESNELLWFMYVYSLGAYAKVNGLGEKISRTLCFAIAGADIVVTYLYAVLVDYFQMKSALLIDFSNYFYKMQSLFCVVSSLFLFLGFMKMEIKNSKIINSISGTTFGIYLIHDEGMFSPFLWNVIFKSVLYTKSIWFILYSVLVSVVVFGGCSLIEFIRLKVIETWIIKLKDYILMKSKRLCKIKTE